MVSPLASTNLYSSKSSGLDVYEMVSKTMQSQNTQAPKINAALTSDKTKLSGLGQLQSLLASFQSLARSLSGSGLSTSATSSTKDVLNVITSGSAVAGAHTIKVDQLAQAQVLAAKAQAKADTNIGNGGPVAIKIELGTTSGDTFTPAGTAKTITITNGDTSLQGIAKAINAANAGVTASVTQTADGYVLSLKSAGGAASSMRIDASGDAAVQGLLDFDPAGKKSLTQTAAAQDAMFTVNGTSKTSATNVLTDAVPGTTLTLTGKGSTTLTIAQDSEQITRNITSLVSAYNTLNTKLQGLQDKELQGDSTASRIQGQLARIFNSASGTGSDGSFLNLNRLGISTSKTGELTVDAEKLKAAVAADPAATAALLGGKEKGLVDKLGSQIDAVLGTSGTIQKQSKALNADIATLTVKRANLEKALTMQAQALAQKYSQMGQLGGSTGTLFDLM
ncbi:Flagellar hook-associated protein 2 [Andreprevotia sp. IGB-42]|uniref:flagellar filament capping protein FliD n=1 Tax=Andreprevotia sp. IGB-42 TaxID=2497473 RepID=UPI0013595414|nr:flagellar filament capping protein FliD [Andreprevotia sp. IGB-42]KAF0811938.1 Flagellar hook-associated protein 2 [Andreprevotia sp. IGB-42]